MIIRKFEVEELSQQREIMIVVIRYCKDRLNCTNSNCSHHERSHNSCQEQQLGNSLKMTIFLSLRIHEVLSI